MKSDGVTIYDLAPGKVVGSRYEIVGPHRQGGLSTAFEVTDKETGERREMQLFPAGLFEVPEQALEFTALLSPWLEVESDSVLLVRDILPVPPNSLALVTDYPWGDSLRVRLNEEGLLDAPFVLAVGRQLLEGLEAIHAKSLVHGDIKPYTIHIEKEGAEAEAVLVDGGVTPGLWTAKGLGDKTALIGTPYYAPIEQFGGDSPDVQSDVYNLATVMFEALTGVLPWSGTTFLEVFQAKLDKSPPSMSSRSPEVEVDPEIERAIVGGCLADRKQRYASAHEFLEELNKLTV